MRIKNKDVDFAIVNLYLCPFVGDHATATNHALIDWANDYLNQLPSRCTPFITTDGNGTVGRDKLYDGCDEIVGPEDDGILNRNGKLLLRLAHTHTHTHTHTLFLLRQHGTHNTSEMFMGNNECHW